MNSSLAKAIIQTIAYFDIFDLPLTAEEVYRFLWRYDEVISYVDFLNTLPNVGHIEQKDGFYFLPGRADIVASRQLAVPLIEEKLRIARRAAKIIRSVPFLRAMFVCNTVASASASRDSDIDVFIVVRRGRLWITRFLTTIALSVFRLRRTKTNVANKICLSFYVTDAHLDLSDIAIDTPDIYLMYWIEQLVLVYDPDNLKEELSKKNQWVKKYLPHGFQSYHISDRYRVQNTPVQRFFRHIAERAWHGSYGDILERYAKQIQEKKMSANVGSVQGLPDTRVVVDDTMLKFHENDRRLHFRDEWRSRLSVYDLNI
jgi:hypothetical protein